MEYFLGVCSGFFAGFICGHFWNPREMFKIPYAESDSDSEQDDFEINDPYDAEKLKDNEDQPKHTCQSET